MISKVSNAYVSDDLKCRVLSSSRHELISMLFDAIFLSLSRAKAFLENSQSLDAGQEIARASEILTVGLLGSLEGVGSEPLADDLHSLYSYCATTLVRARFAADASLISEVEELLFPIHEAWKTIGSTAAEEAASALSR